MRQIAREDVFRIVTEEVLRKGYVEDGENQALVRLTHFLKLEAEVAREIARTARSRMAAESRNSSAGPTPIRLYWRVLEHLHDDAGLDANGEQVLHALRVLFRVPDDVHHNLKKQLSSGAAVVQVSQLGAPASHHGDRRVASTQTRLPRPVAAANPVPTPSRGVPRAAAAVAAVAAAPVEELPPVETGHDHARASAAEITARALDLAARLAREFDVDGAMRAVEPALRVRPAPEGFEMAYQSVLRALVEDAAGTQSVDAMMAVVQFAARVAAGTAGDTYRWTAFVDVLGQAGTALAGWGRWPEHAKLLPELDRMSELHAAVTPLFRARALADSVRRCLAGGQYDQAQEYYRGFSKVLAWMSQDEVRAEYSASQAAIVEYIVGHKDSEREAFTQLMGIMQGLIKNHGRDRRLCKAFNSVAASAGVMYLKIGDAKAMNQFISCVAEVVRSFPGDEEMALSFAKALLNTTIVGKELARQTEASLGFFAGLKAKIFPKPIPMMADLVTGMTVVVASVPQSDAMSDIRKRFEGLTSAKLLTQKNPHRVPKAASKVPVKAR